MLRRPEVFSVVRACLSRVYRLSRKRLNNPPDTPVVVNIRNFLCSFMITFFQANVFETIGPLETRLIASATALINSFELIILSTHRLREWRLVPAEIARPFCTNLSTYVEIFMEWRGIDGALVIGRIQRALLALYGGSLAATNDIHRYELHHQITRLRSKLLEISSQEAVQAFEADHPPPPTPRSPLATPHAARIPTDEKIVHELLLDQDYTIALAKVPLNDAFWEVMASDTVHPAPCFGRHMYVLRGVVDAVNEIKLTFSDADIGALEERFVGLEVEKPPAMQILDDVLDSMFPLMTPALAAIVRSTWGVSATTNWHHAYTAALRFMHNTAETMLLETCEERIHLLVHSGIGFELERFHARVGDDGLRRTQVISSSLFCSTDLVITKSPQAWVSQSGWSLPSSILKLISSPINPATFPETLILDLPRIAAMKKEYDRILDTLVIIKTATHAVDMAGAGNQVVDAIVAGLVGEVDWYEKIEEWINPLLEGSGINTPGRAILLYQITDSRRPNHSARLVVAEQLPSMLLGGGELGELAVSFLSKFEALCEANRLLHSTTYERLMRA